MITGPAVHGLMILPRDLGVTYSLLEALFFYYQSLPREIGLRLENSPIFSYHGRGHLLLINLVFTRPCEEKMVSSPSLKPIIFPADLKI